MKLYFGAVIAALAAAGILIHACALGRSAAEGTWANVYQLK